VTSAREKAYYGLYVEALKQFEVALELIRKRILKEYPSVEVASYSPPYKKEFSLEDSKKMVDACQYDMYKHG